ncbi:MAG: sigma-70 family RNA polymerase sigma factor [Bacteroidales bacterium]|nr:sigma-70 family RNA polymerase sigma factor [Bacteroidales bacterium]
MEINDENKKVDPNAEIYLLVQRAKKGDEQAFGQLMGKYRMSVFYLILKMVKNEDDAEDLTIEVFSKVYFNIDMYAETHSFSTWLFKIASNHAIDFIRKKKNQQRPLKIDQPLNEETNWYFDIASEDPDPEKLMMITQKEDAIKNIIDVLPEEIRIVMRMRVFDEMPYKEIAEKLDIAIGTVKARLFRGRNMLATLINRKLNF